MDRLGVRRSEAVLLAGVLALAFAARFAGAYFGLPHVYHPDEGFEVYRALRLGMGGYDFDRVAKGGYYLLLFLEYGVFFVVQKLTGAIQGVSDFARLFIEDPSPFWKIGRATTAVLGTLTVLLTWFQGRRIGVARVGLLAAGFLAVSFQHVVDSHTITVDVPMTLFTFASIVLVVEDAAGRSRLRPVLFAFVAAYAIMNKLPAVLLFLPFFLGALLRGGVRGPSGLLSRATLVPALLTAVVYLAANPGFLVNLRDMIELVSHTVGGATEKSEEYGAVPLETNLWSFYASTIVRSQGAGVVLLAIAGAGLAIVARRRELLLHLAFLIPFYMLIAGTSSSHLYYARYVLPLLPGICLLAAFAMDALASRVRAPRLVAAFAALAAVILGLPPARPLVDWDRRLLREDTRTAAARWIEANVPSGSRILLEGFPEETAQLALPLRNSLENIDGMIARLRSTDPGKAKFWEMKREAWRDPAYDLETIRHFEDWETLAEVRGRGIEWVVVRREFFAPGLRHETKFGDSTVTTRYAFRSELEKGLGAACVAFFDADPNGAPGYDVEIWRLDLGGEEANAGEDGAAP